MAIFSTKKKKRRKRRRRRHHVKRKKATTPTPKPAPKPAPKPTPAPSPDSRHRRPTPSPEPDPAPVAKALAATSRERLFLNRFGTGFTQRALTQLRAAGTPGGMAGDPALPHVGARVRQGRHEVDGWFDSCGVHRRRSTRPTRPRPRPPGSTATTSATGSILRRVYSERSVLETMTDFWSTVMHIPVGHDRAWVYRFDYDATIREQRTRQLRGPARRLLAAPGDARLPRQLEVGEEQAQREPGT